MKYKKSKNDIIQIVDRVPFESKRLLNFLQLNCDNKKELKAFQDKYGNIFHYNNGKERIKAAQNDFGNTIKKVEKDKLKRADLDLINISLRQWVSSPQLIRANYKFFQKDGRFTTKTCFGEPKEIKNKYKYTQIVRCKGSIALLTLDLIQFITTKQGIGVCQNISCGKFFAKEHKGIKRKYCDDTCRITQNRRIYRLRSKAKK
jgi:hypothetical protein